MQFINQYSLKLLLIVILSFGTLSGCLHDKETKPAPNSNDDTGNGNDSTANSDASNLPTVSVSILDKDSYEIREGLGTVNVAVSLDKASADDIDIAISLRPGTATPANDFAFVTAGRNLLVKQFTILAARTFPGENIQIRITSDDIYEGDETFQLSVVASGANVPSAPDTYTIIDDDTIPVLQIKEVVKGVTVPKEALETNGELVVTVELHPSTLPTELEIPFDLITTPDLLTRADINQDISYPDTLVIPAETKSATFTILATGDAVIEKTETFTFALREPEPIKLGEEFEKIKLGDVTDITLSIIDDDEIKDLNETGQTLCANATNPVEDCSNTTDFPLQDANLERNGGEFSLTMLQADGMSDPTENSPATCVRDNHTNLTWELKSADAGFQYSLNEYSWFDSKGNSNGGNRGFNGSTLNCGKIEGGSGGPTACDTEKYAIYLNTDNFCSKTGWRTPTVSELQSIVDFSNTDPENETLANLDSFPNLQPGYYWSATPSALDDQKAWVVYLGKELVLNSELIDNELKSNRYLLIMVTNE